MKNLKKDVIIKKFDMSGIISMIKNKSKIKKEKRNVISEKLWTFSLDIYSGR